MPSHHGKRVHKSSLGHAGSFQRFRALHKDETDKEDAEAQKQDEEALTKPLEAVGTNGTAAAVNGTEAAAADADALPTGNATATADGNATAEASESQEADGNTTEVKMSAEDLAIANGEQLVFDDKKHAGPELPSHCKDHDVSCRKPPSARAAAQRFCFSMRGGGCTIANRLLIVAASHLPSPWPCADYALGRRDGGLPGLPPVDRCGGPLHAPQVEPAPHHAAPGCVATEVRGPLRQY